ncbi:SsrA-binding protein SmpB [Actinomarinicola tropica]|uniref:SsrA-binding protein n=1 Tax=Actinomarinicola tropica TaxID=2789776 RepID=A0A5Q2RMI6_9ACTN|nr:SsrA-binding protein SmpB [Actinomarinicola tropica]QGG95771.1 SsrA-binding protein SmpB [Actinomarinicola tropica]
MAAAGKTPKKGAKSADDGTKVIATNRRARREYEILDTVEAGLVLRGSEVKSLRDAKVQLAEGFGRIKNGEAWLHAVHISPWISTGLHDRIDPERIRKLLLNKHEIERLGARQDQEHLTLVPLSIYFKGGRAKVELGLARGRKDWDKRQAIAQRDADREARKAMSRRMSGKDAV